MMVLESVGLAVEDIMTVRHVKNKVKYVNKTIKKNKRHKKQRKDHDHAANCVVPRSVPTVLQQLFVTCREIFKGPGTVPLPSDVSKLSAILDKVELEDFGLSKNLPIFKAKGAMKNTPTVSSATIYQCEEFSLCIFFLPATAVIPLHNHPGMTVFSKLLHGKMHIKSYDWVDPVNSHNSTPSATSQPRLAKLKANSVFTAPCDTSVLYPTTGGNIHQFTAKKPCAVLDVLGPPYSEEDDRDCSYYKDFPCSAFPNNGGITVSEEEGASYGWLQEIEVPENLKMVRINYLGPRPDQVIETDDVNYLSEE